MTCAETADLIGPYVDDDLPEGVRRRVESHLLTCATCAWDAETQRITLSRLRDGAGDVVASDAFRARTLAKLVTDNPHVSPASEHIEAEDPTQYRLPMPF